MLRRLRSPPLNVFFTGLPTTASRRSLKPSSISLRFEPPDAIAPGKMRRADRGGELQVLADGQMLVERVLLRDVTDVALELRRGLGKATDR